jgi:hypothetical protein
MANQGVTDSINGTSFKDELVDMGDGTKARRMYIAGGGSGGGAVTIANDNTAAPALGYTAETAYSDATGATASGLVGLAKGIYVKAAAIASSVAGTLTTSNATIGTTTDAAIITDANGTAIGFLRGLVRFVYERMPSSLGQKARAASLAVAWSTEQEALVGGLTETAPATDTASSGLNGRLQRIAQRVTSMIALLPAALGQGTMAQSLRVVLPSDQYVSVVGNQATVGVEFTRPADTTAYTTKDVVSDSTSSPSVISFAAARAAAGNGYITKAKLTTDQKTNTATYRLWLYSSTPTAINDNSPYTLLYADNAIRLGFIDFTALATEDPTNSTGATSLYVGVPLAYKCAATTVFGILETRADFTPASGQKFYVELTFDQN